MNDSTLTLGAFGTDFQRRRTPLRFATMVLGGLAVIAAVYIAPVTAAPPLAQALDLAPPDPATMPHGSIVGWGKQVVASDLSHGFMVRPPGDPRSTIAAGGSRSLGLKADGSIVAWGENWFGQTDIPAPNSGFVAAAAGSSYSLGLKADGSIVAWGDNSYGQTNIPAPNTDFIAIAAGGSHNLGLKADGSIGGWGGNEYGQTDIPAPNSGFVAITAGSGHNLALKADGSIVAWGRNNFGQTDVPAPNGDFIGLAAGVWHSVGLRADGSIVAWGRNHLGQTDVPAPNTDFVAVAAGSLHSLGLKADGSIVAWGNNWEGQTNAPSPNTGFVAVAAGDYHSLGLKADGAVVAWGGNYSGQTNVPAPNTGFVAVAAGGWHSLGLRADGSIAIVAWGPNLFGVPAPTNVPAPNANFIGIVAGDYHSLGLKADGYIVAWGAGELNTGEWPHFGQSIIPAPNADFMGIAAGGAHSLGMKADGSIVAWGCGGDTYYDRDRGQCNVPAPNTDFVAVAAGGAHSLGMKADGSIVAWGATDPVPLPNSGFVAIAAGGSHNLGLKADGSIVAWGDNYSGQTNVPAPNTGFVAVAAGGWHSLGLKADGSIEAWGAGACGQSGWPHSGQSCVPAPNSGFVAIAAGGQHSLGIRGGAPMNVVNVTPAARFDPATGTVSVSARAYNASTGQAVTGGSAFFSIEALGRSGTLTFDGSEWTGSVDVGGGTLLSEGDRASSPQSSNIDLPLPGTYNAQVHVISGKGSVVFIIPGESGIVRGTVFDAADQPVEGATVTGKRLGDVPYSFLIETNDNGEYERTDVPPGWYSLSAEAEGYFKQVAAVHLHKADAVEQDFTLTSTDKRILRHLDTGLWNLYQAVRDAMDAQTTRLSDMSGTTAGHFDRNTSGGEKAWKVASFFAGILGGVTDLDPSKMDWVLTHGSQETATAVVQALIDDAATSAFIQVGWLTYFEGANLIIAEATKSMIPHEDGLNQWRKFSVAELKETGPYQQGRAALDNAYHNEFRAIANTFAVPAEFDFSVARDIIGDLRMKMYRIQSGELISDLTPPTPDAPFMYASFPGAYAFWRSIEDQLIKVGGLKKVTTTIQAGANILAVGATVSVVGATVGLVAGKVAYVARHTGLALNAIELHLISQAAKQYIIAIKQWGNDMLTLPTVYLRVWEFLQDEAAEPKYLSGDRSRFNADAELHMNPDRWRHGRPYILTTHRFFFASEIVSREAQVVVTNTGTERARFRVVGISHADFQGGRTITSGSGYLDLDPGESDSIHIPYAGVFNWRHVLSKEHSLGLQLYIGPFLYGSLTQKFFVERRTIFETALESGRSSPRFSFTFLRDGQSMELAGEDEEEFEPTITDLGDGEILLTPDEPVFETVFDAIDVPVLEFQMHSDAHGVVELRVCDKLGRCVGYDSSFDGVVTEFPAVHSGDASTSQRVYIPSPDADAYTVRAVLTGAMSEQPVRVSLWAIETPMRPAVMGVAPFGYTSRLYWDETATVPLAIGEAGGQVPLTGVSVSVGDVIGPDGVSALSVVEGGEQAFSVIPAGTNEAAEVQIHIPRGILPGTYEGIITVASESAGVQEGLIEIVVLPPGDMNADGVVDLDDWRRIEDEQCISGPDETGTNLFCRPVDLNGDGYIDLRDLADLQGWFRTTEVEP